MIVPFGLVGLVTPRYAPAIGGVEHHVERLARGLVQRGVPVEVITTDPTAQLPATEERAGVLVRRFPTIRRDGVYFLAPGLGWWLIRNASRFALLHAHSYHTPLAAQAALASRWHGVPLGVTPHYHGTKHSPLRQALHVPYRPIGWWVLHQARRVICVSSAERSLLHHDFGPTLPTMVISNGVEPAALVRVDPRELPAGRVLVLTVGRLERYKQTERLVAALPHLPASYHVLVVGDGPARPQIERAALELGMHERLRVLGHVPQQELLAWYRTATVYVSLSRHEAFGVTLLEAAAAGAAIVASDLPAQREVAGYLPPGRVSFVSPVASGVEVARAVQEAAGLGRRPDAAAWPLPTWEAAVDHTLSCYGTVLHHPRVA